MSEMIEEIDQKAYRRAYDYASTQGYSPVSGDLFAEWYVSNHLDRVDPLGWDVLSKAFGEWEARQAEIGTFSGPSLPPCEV